MHAFSGRFFFLWFFVFTLSLSADITTGLVAHYEFEGNANDSSGNENNLTVYQDTYFSAGLFGDSATLDGNDSLAGPTLAVLSGASGMSISSWVNLTSSVSGLQTIARSDFVDYALRFNSGNLEFSLASVLDSSTNVRFLSVPVTDAEFLNKWTHVSATFFNNGTNSVLRIYINGVEVASDTTQLAGNITIDTLGEHSIGAWSNNGAEGMAGQMDDVRIYNRALTSADISQLYYQSDSIAYDYAVGASSSQTFEGQSFTAIRNDNITSIEVANGQTGGNVVNLRIYNGETVCDTSLAATSGAIYEEFNLSLPSTFPASPNTTLTGDASPYFYTLELDTPLGITQGSQYTFCLETVSGASAIALAYDNSANIRYSGGNAYNSTDGILTAVDFAFRINFEDPKLSLAAHGGAVQFDNVGSHINIPSGLSLVSDENNSLTIEGWVKTVSTELDDIFANNIGTTTNQLQFRMTADGLLEFGMNSDLEAWTNITSTTIINDGNWHHVSVVKNGITATIYVDGNEENSSSAFTHIYTPIESIIGGYTSTGGYIWNGEIDEIRVWNTTRTQADIQATMNHQLDGNETGLVAYYNFDERIGSTVKDITANGYDGTMEGNVTRLNFLGDVLDFSAVNAVVDVGDIQNGAAESTMAAWVKLGDAYDGQGDVVMYKQDVHSMQVKGSNLYWDDGISATCTGKQILDKNRWYYITTTYNDATDEVKLYVDGILDNNCTITSTPHTSANPRTIGNFNNIYNFNGRISEVSLWNRALSETEIQNLMASAPDTADTDLAGYWPLNEGVGTTIKDYSSYGNDGNITSATWTNTAPEIYGDKIYTDYGIHSWQKLVAKNVATPAFTQSGTNVSHFDAATGIFLYSDLSGSETFDANETSASLTLSVNVLSTREVTAGTTGDDSLTGTVGDDVFIAGAGNDTVNGNTGTDTVVFSGNQADYIVVDNGNGSYTVTGPDGTDTLSNIELLDFDDIQGIAITSMVTEQVNVNLVNVNLAEHNITAVWMVGQDGNAETFEIDPAYLFVDGENNLSAPVYNVDQNFSIRLDVNNSDVIEEWWYNFTDSLVYMDNNGSEEFKTTVTAANNTFAIDANGSNWITTPVGPLISVTPAAIDFGTLIVGQSSTEYMVTVSNVGDANLTISDVNSSNGDFNISNYCPVELEMDTNCSIGVIYTPSTEANITDTLLIGSDDPASPTGITLTAASLVDSDGDGVADASDAFPLDVAASVDTDGDGYPDYWNSGYTEADSTTGLTLDAYPSDPSQYGDANISVTPAVLDFGSMLSGESAFADLNISNSGTMDLNISGFGFSGSLAADFNLSETNCSQSGTSYIVPPQTLCFVTVGFTAADVGENNASFDIYSNDTDESNKSIALTADVKGALLQVTPDALDFGDITVGESSSENNITLINVGDFNLTLTEITSTHADFNIANYCPDELIPEANCTIGVTFSPSQESNITAILEIGSNDPKTSESVVLAGTGVLPVGTDAAGTITLPASYGQSVTAILFAATTRGEATMSREYVLTPGDVVAFSLRIPEGMENFRIGYALYDLAGGLVQHAFFAESGTTAYEDGADILTTASLPASIVLNVLQGRMISGTLTLPQPASEYEQVDITASTDLLGMSGRFRHELRTQVQFEPGSQSAEYNLTVPSSDISAKYYVGYDLSDNDGYVRQGYYGMTATTPYFHEATPLDLRTADQNGIDITVIDGVAISGTASLAVTSSEPMYLLVRAIREDGYEVFGGTRVKAGETSVYYNLDVPVTTVPYSYRIGYYLLEDATPRFVDNTVIGYWSSTGTVPNKAKAEAFSIQDTPVAGKDFTVSDTSVQTVGINAGWNLLSLPAKAEFTLFDMILHFSFNDEGVIHLAKYGKAGWSYYMVKGQNAAVNRFGTLRSGEGFWLRSTQSFALRFALSDDSEYADELKPLYPGWNLVGTNKEIMASQLAEQYRITGYEGIESLWIYRNDAWYLYTPDVTLDAMVDATIPRIDTPISKYDGVWIRVKGTQQAQEPPQ